MKRRTYLRSLGVAGTAGVVGTAGCLDTFDQALSDDDSRTILPAADGHPEDPGYPSHGNEFPSFSIPDPVAETNVSLEDFVGERSFLLTYFFTTCPDGVCPALLTRLRWAQDDAIDRGYADDLGLLAFTFDPERDTPEVLTEYATQQNIEYEAENFHFLRPESYEEAKRLMTDTFGMALQREEDGENGDDESNGTEGTDESNESADGNESHDEHDHGAYTFTHNSRITLVNEDGIVERAYPNAVQSERAVDRKRLLEETRTVVGVE
ncbi:SCO family protein [Natronorubrum halophilum]|uniref:SCO family protein n=1 Tax=Natronorubrum halophilum TaxID=1702106 RepID=UPI000EF6BCE0|nr:SCO family protein [Natronorubrum halophilum]